MAICKCNLGLGNTGTPNCTPLFSVIRKVIFVPTFDNNGNKNSIDLTTTLDAAFLTTQLNAASDVRWFPLPEMENVVPERAESAFEEAPSGTRAFVKQGSRNITGEIWESAQPRLAGKIKSARCTPTSAYIIDGNGNLIGTGDPTDTTKLFPVKLDSQSIDAILMFATDTTRQKVNVAFSWDDSVQDEDLYMIQAGVDFTFDALEAEGLLDILATYSNITTSGFTVELFTEYGSLKDLVVDSGLVVGDFSAAELSPTPGAVPLTSAAESPNGTYAIVFTAPATSGDVIELTPSKDGRDYTAVIANTITIP
jgi:hypothetical protein